MQPAWNNPLCSFPKMTPMVRARACICKCASVQNFCSDYLTCNMVPIIWNTLVLTKKKSHFMDSTIFHNSNQSQAVKERKLTPP
ncbi:hypothetical protein NC651_036763 [Populus alba x Populus x berolinensis]|nr:hypothetical protein NC651_036763 [Populus alba x Populus x berolinensis]